MEIPIYSTLTDAHKSILSYVLNQNIYIYSYFPISYHWPPEVKLGTPIAIESIDVNTQHNNFDGLDGYSLTMYISSGYVASENEVLNPTDYNKAVTTWYRNLLKL